MSNLTIKLKKFKLNLVSLLPEVTKETKERIIGSATNEN